MITASFLNQLRACGSHCRDRGARFHSACELTVAHLSQYQNRSILAPRWHVLTNGEPPLHMELAGPLERIFLLSVCTTHLALIILWWTDTKVTPMTRPFWYSCLCDPFSLGTSRICDLLLMNGIWKGDGMSLP